MSREGQLVVMMVILMMVDDVGKGSFFFGGAGYWGVINILSKRRKKYCRWPKCLLGKVRVRRSGGVLL